MENFSRASETNPLKIKWSITWRFFQPGVQFSSCNRKEISARAEKQEIIWLPDSPETLRNFIFGAETNISARAEVRHVIATKFQPGLPG